MTRLRKFIEALTIFDKYDPEARTGAEHDEFYVYGRKLDENVLSVDDRLRLNELGFEWHDDANGWRRFT